ncbi:DUF4129 domain-containing protein [Gimesia aquarii]|uniref:Protein-glutamine gamma-glutamyltransferase-like C-terminal domain-containing protein n=1 Tax=Gimesia aquarii TaxID=2527964 RepID=A0A517WPN7_9PLAN|nr:DUF4129 domain-containing protein [Gimesia aquarii]QDU07214.1 hypothetical protein V202x_05650 [Gimesia aquarii]
MIYHLPWNYGPVRRFVLSFVLITCFLLDTTTIFSQTIENDYSKALSPDRTIIEQDTRQILSRPEFRHLTQQRETASDLPFDWEAFLKESQEQEANAAEPFFFAFGGLFLLILSYAFIFSICCLILYLLYRSFKGIDYARKKSDEPKGTQLQGEVIIEQIVSPAENEASIYLQRAKKFAKSGDYHNAIVQLLYGSMSFIERSGWIRFRKGLTYRDYLRAARPHGLPGDSFRKIIRTYEPLGFGRREATKEHFESTLNSYEAAFQKKA